ncbi:MAG: hypothetical protein RRC34_02475 [Lentisphaeria bacterium]|nr:hypothetical protein [Lentisphaeria bacterium]
MSAILFFIGVMVTSLGFFLFMMEAFKENMLWGLGCLIIAPLQLIFLLLYWDVAGKPFLIEAAGFALLCLGLFLGSGA